MAHTTKSVFEGWWLGVRVPERAYALETHLPASWVQADRSE